MSEPEFTPLQSVDFISPKTHNLQRSVGALIGEGGELIISGLDWGEEAQTLRGGDYEYSLTIKHEHKDSVLLLLLKERFADFPDARQWLEEQGIPATFWHWG